MVEQAIGGDRTAFEQLIRAYDPEMRSVAWRIVRDDFVIDDALQDAYVNAYRAIGSYRADGPFGAWLRRIVVNAATDHVRRVARNPELLGFDELGDSLADASVEQTPAHLEALGDALSRLPAQQRLMVVLVDWEGYSYQEAATMTGTSVASVGNRLWRARSALRRILEQA